MSILSCPEPASTFDHSFGKEWLFDRRKALVHFPNFLRIDIYAKDVKPALGQSRRNTRPQLAKPAHRYFSNRLHGKNPVKVIDDFAISSMQSGK